MRPIEQFRNCSCSSTLIDPSHMSARTEKRVLRAVALALAFLGCSLASNLTRAVARGDDRPARVESTQPIAFSHKLHAQQKLECTICHENADPGEGMSIPDAELCMSCHQAIATEKPAIKQLAQFAREKKAIPWFRIYSLPAFVFWSHRTHLAAGQPCTACHGKVTEMDVIRPTNVTTMDACVDCHDKKDANTGCATCHESRTS
jgi:hypothetical protein